MNEDATSDAGPGASAQVPARAQSPFGRRGAKLAPVLVFVLVAGAAVAAFGVTRRVSDNQERKLLSERSAEVASLLSTSLGGAESSLEVLAAGLRLQEPGFEAVFSAAAQPLIAQEGVSVGLLSVDSEEVRLELVEGAPLNEGELVEADRSAVARRAFAEQGTAIGLFEDDGGVHLMMAVPAPGGAVFQDVVIDPAQAIPATPDSPFSELRIALYASSEPDPDRLVASTETEVPLTGRVHRTPLRIGSEQWSVSVAPRHHLTGSLTRTAPWALLGGGLVSAGLAAAVVSVLARRHEYALNLVATRTADLAKARSDAERANRSKSEFLSRMSHELRTPLTAVLGFGQLLEMGELTDEQRESVRHIRKGGRHLLELINEVLDISRVESGNIALSPEPVHVGDLITDVIDLIKPLAQERGIQVVPDRSGAWDAHFLADRQRAQQILLNLLSNAIKYNRQRGTVAVSVTAGEGSEILVSVADTGPGIRRDQLDLVFLPFERLGAEQTDTEGSGVGLALSLKLAEAMGGTITVDSSLGRGSTFVLRLPAVEGPVDRYERLHAKGTDNKPASAESQERTVLYIEDNLSNVTLVERVMATRSGVKLVTAMQGRLGVELAREHEPVLILLDLHLPDMPGDQVLERLRDDPHTASTPVVILSADATPGQVQRLLSVGAAAYLTKPIDIQELLRVIDDALARQTSRE